MKMYPEIYIIMNCRLHLQVTYQIFDTFPQDSSKRPYSKQQAHIIDIFENIKFPWHKSCMNFKQYNPAIDSKN